MIPARFVLIYTKANQVMADAKAYKSRATHPVLTHHSGHTIVRLSCLPNQV